ncbi:MAG: hypothetical protein R2860_05050 [Desulfobacterales bacterium]
MAVTVRAQFFPSVSPQHLPGVFWGSKVGDIDRQDRLQHNVRAPSGAIIREIDKHSALANINARPGDVIRKIDDITVDTVED